MTALRADTLKCASTMKTLLDGAGRIEIPDFVQLSLGIKPGDELAFEEENGKWFIMPAKSCNDPLEARRPCPAQTQTDHPAAGTEVDDLHWEELDYQPVPRKRAGEVALRVEHRGKLKPMAHDLDDE
jgi:bifunctional DNA-binding transcriptional regulator/antitoxin component of YhaV-PrlF toxin-antitoxin module